METIVFIELKRHGYKITVGKIKDYEIDYVCKKNNKKMYIQVAYLLEKFRPLLLIKDNYPKYVLSMDKTFQSQNGIKHMNIIDFLKNFNHDEIF